MQVSKRMTPNPITASSETTHRQAVKLMQEHDIRRLPIVDKHGKLIGIVSETDLLSAGPSPATSLSVYEIYDLLDKLKMGQIMSAPVLTIQEACDLAAAARFMLERKIGCLPVMRGDELVGIITETDVYKSFIEVLGGGEAGLRVDVRLPDKTGQLAKIARAVADAGGNILALTQFRDVDAGFAEMTIKEQGADEAQLKAALDQMDDVEIIRIRQGGTDQPEEFG